MHRHHTRAALMTMTRSQACSACWRMTRSSRRCAGTYWRRSPRTWKTTSATWWSWWASASMPAITSRSPTAKLRHSLTNIWPKMPRKHRSSRPEVWRTHTTSHRTCVATWTCSTRATPKRSPDSTCAVCPCSCWRYLRIVSVIFRIRIKIRTSTEIMFWIFRSHSRWRALPQASEPPWTHRLLHSRRVPRALWHPARMSLFSPLTTTRSNTHQLHLSRRRGSST